MGLRRIGDLLGLPRAGLARRFGKGRWPSSTRALGRRPDPRVPMAPARLFESRLELFARADSSRAGAPRRGGAAGTAAGWLAAQQCEFPCAAFGC